MSEPRPVDFHVHLDLYPDMEEAFDYCVSRKAIALVVTTTPRAFERDIEIADGRPDIHVGLGIHPQLVGGDRREIERFEQLAERTRFIGEIGLDASREHYGSFDKQQKAFDRALNICHEMSGKVISVHSVRTASKVLSAIEKSRVFVTCQIVLHWFSGSKAEISRAASMGCMFSLNEAHLRTDAGIRLVRNAPTSSLLTETDGPFLLRDDVVVGPSDVANAVRALSQLLDLPARPVAQMIEENARRALERKHAVISA